MNQTVKTGFVLSGGGARGIAHLGAMKALEEMGIRPDVLSGVSAGGVVGALYAAGYRPDKILDIIVAMPLLRIMRPAVSWLGLLNLETLERLFQRYLPPTFEELTLPLTLSATDLNRGRTVFFHEGPLIRPLMASCCIPVMFKPITIEGRVYVDGGILNNLPVEPLLGQCDFIVGIHTNPTDANQPLTSMKAVMERSLLLAVGNNVKERAGHCHLYVEPPTLGRYTTMDLRKAKAIFDCGYLYTREMTEVALTAQQRVSLQPPQSEFVA